MTATSVRISSRRSTTVRASKFGSVGALGLGVNLLVQAVFTEVLGWHYLSAAIIATQVSSTFNFVLAERWVFGAGSAPLGRRARYVSFLLMNNAAFVVRAPMMWVLVGMIGLHYTLGNLLSLMVLTLVRFCIADRVIWKATPVGGPALAGCVDESG